MRMQQNDKNKEYLGSSEFSKIIDQAVYEGANSITIQYDDDGLEVCYWIGPTGIADVFVDRDYEEKLIEYIIEAADLENKPKGIIETELDGTKYKVTVEKYDHFGESAFRLLIRKMLIK
jgi:hypothetical protein